MVRTVNLDEKKHAVKMLRGLKQMREQSNQCDFVIKVGAKEYHAHKNVLSVGSPYFEAMLKHNLKERREGKVEMKHVDFECVKSCIDFMYTGSFDIPNGKISDLLHVAVMLQLDDVKTAIREILHQDLTVVNFFETRNVAELYGFRTLSSKCQILYEEKLLVIYTQPQFKYEDKSYLIEALKSKKLLLSESKKLDACLTWFRFNPHEKESLSEMFKHIKLTKVASKVLRDLVENNSIVRSNVDTCKLIEYALAEISKKSNSRIVLLGYTSLPRRSRPLTPFRLEFYDPSTTEVRKFHVDLVLPKYFSVISMDNYIYILSGQIIGRFDFIDKASRWKRMEDMLFDHGTEPPVVSLLGSLFVIARGCKWFGSEPVTKDVERFDPEMKKWFDVKDIPQAISNPIVVSLDDSFYCIGGCRISNPTTMKQQGINSVCRFTPVTSEWVDLEPMRVARVHCGAVALEQKIYVMGCFHADMAGSSECYDITTGQWSFITPMTIPDRNYPIDAHYIDGHIFVMERGTMETVEKYDLDTDKWSKVDFNEDIYSHDFESSVIVEL